MGKHSCLASITRLQKEPFSSSRGLRCVIPYSFFPVERSGCLIAVTMVKLNMYGRGLPLRMAIMFTCQLAFIFFGEYLLVITPTQHSRTTAAWIDVLTLPRL